MFGKKSSMKSSNSRFIMSAGRAAGNLKSTFKGDEYQNKKGGARNPGGKETPMRKGGVSLGQASTVNLRGKVKVGY